MELDTRAAHAAELFWWTARQDLARSTVSYDDLLEALEDEERAKTAMALFDTDDDGYIVEEEAHARFHKIYRCGLRIVVTLFWRSGRSPGCLCTQRSQACHCKHPQCARASAQQVAHHCSFVPVQRHESCITDVPCVRRERRDMATTLQNTSGVLDTLEALVGGIMHVCGFCAYLAIFGVNVSHLIISLSSVLVAASFVFGNSLQTVYESVLFLFLVRPYKVGDALWYNGATHSVSSFGLMWTHLYRCATSHAADFVASRACSALHDIALKCGRADRASAGVGHTMP